MIDEQLKSFLQDAVGIHLGSRNVWLEPNGVRATAVRVESDGEHFVVYVPKVAAGRVLHDLKANEQAAVTFGRPIDERACQVKGTFVSVRAAKADEQRYIQAQWESFRANLEQIGIPREGAAGWPIWPSVAIRLRATAVFNQTPGAGAGTQIA